MKRLLFLLILVGILSINSVKGVTSDIIEIGSGTVSTNVISLKVTLVNQDPYPADPGDYVNLLFKVENRGSDNAENVVFKLLPEYPFSLDTGVSADTELGTIKGLQTDENGFLIKYKVRVNKDAINGENKIGTECRYNNGNTLTNTFNITISNPRTDMDVVVQDATTASTTLAIANIGANNAYSVIVRIPDQQNFRVTGTSASVIGNLNAGDYTLVSFQITSNTGIANISSAGGNMPPNRSFSRTTFNNSVIGGGNLAVEISYTDTLGIRRTIQKGVRLDVSGTTGTGTRTGLATQGSQLKLPSGGLMYIGIGVVGIIVIVVIFRFRRRKKR
jgi:hypothetical protein